MYDDPPFDPNLDPLLRLRATAAAYLEGAAAAHAKACPSQSASSIAEITLLVESLDQRIAQLKRTLSRPPL